jgi:sporulation protein YlmC with PRC-barrel domain
MEVATVIATKSQNTVDLVGMQIVGQHGRIVGVITATVVDVESWQLSSVKVDLQAEVLNKLKLQHPWFGHRSVYLPVSHISGASDVLVLNEPLETMTFSKTKPSSWE